MTGAKVVLSFMIFSPNPVYIRVVIGPCHICGIYYEVIIGVVYLMESIGDLIPIPPPSFCTY